MFRLSRLVLGALTISLSFAGPAIPCAHEAPVADIVATEDHAGPASHSGHEPADEPERCDDAEATCCDAIASCSMAAVASRGSSVRSFDLPGMSAFAAASFRPHGLLLEVATPPPRA